MYSKYKNICIYLAAKCSDSYYILQKKYCFYSKIHPLVSIQLPWVLLNFHYRYQDASSKFLRVVMEEIWRWKSCQALTMGPWKLNYGTLRKVSASIWERKQGDLCFQDPNTQNVCHDLCFLLGFDGLFLLYLPLYIISWHSNVLKYLKI